jgi:hypothetical protein
LAVHPWVGLDPCLSFCDKNVFYKVGSSAARPTLNLDWLIDWLALDSSPNGSDSLRPYIPTWKISVLFLVWVSTCHLSGMGVLTSSYTTPGIALRGIWPIKPHHYIKVLLLYEGLVSLCFLLWQKCTRLAFYWIATVSVSRKHYHQRFTKWECTRTNFAIGYFPVSVSSFVYQLCVTVSRNFRILLYVRQLIVLKPCIQVMRWICRIGSDNFVQCPFVG